MTDHKHLVQIIGAPIACEEGILDTWREVAAWAERQLRARFGEDVQLRYYGLFDADCPAFPQDSQLPVVMVNDEIISSGGKISIPLITKTINNTSAR